MKRWLGVFAIVLGSALWLTAIYGELLREQVLRPVLYGLWLLWLRLQGLPFDPIWLVFITLATLAIYLAVTDLFFKSIPERAVKTKLLAGGPLRALAHKIKLSCAGDLTRWNLHRTLGDLTIDWIALHRNCSEREARRRFQAGYILPQLGQALALDFPDPDRKLPTKKTKEDQLQELANLIEQLEDFAAYAKDRR